MIAPTPARRPAAARARRGSRFAPAVLLLGIAQDDAPTFNRDVAPLVFEHCATCHRPGEVAPFPLLDYRDVAKRARQLVAVTRSRFMPPWQPERGDHAFQGDRSLDEAQIELLERWVRGGKAEGDPADLPPLPDFVDGWQLGVPDLVVTMDEEYRLQAEGQDVYRNFVIRAPVEETRWVRAVEFLPSNRPVVHHAVLFVDRTGAARELDAESEAEGFGGMGAGQMQIPDGQFVGWVPGKAPLPGTDDVAWTLDEHTDLVVQAHMQPTGKRERVKMSLGLYFNDEPPTRHPVSIRITSRHIDIPAGESDYLVEQRYTMPVDARLIGIYPHAHYLGKDLRVFATPPGGERTTLIRIPDWDFNWQDEYRYAEPVALPEGTELHMRFLYDNSAQNPRNPSVPPVRVTFGPESRDEMAEVVLQFMTSAEDRPVLMREYVRAEVRDDLAFVTRMAQESPQDPGWLNLAGRYALRLDLAEEAVGYYERLVELTPGNPTPLYNLGRALADAGRAAEALERLDAVIALRSAHVPARLERAKLLERAGRFDEARADYRRAAELAPDDFRVRAGLADLRLAEGDLAGAAAEFEAVLERSPEHLRALRRLAELRVEQGRPRDAIALCERALRDQPQDAQSHATLGRAHLALGDVERARRELELALRLAPESEAIRRHLAALPAQGPPDAREGRVQSDGPSSER